jgi:hypothetical protein
MSCLQSKPQSFFLAQLNVCPCAANGNGLQGTLKQSGSGTQPELGPDITTLSILVENVTPDILHAKIGAPGRWEIPKSIFLAPNVTGMGHAVVKEGLGTLT